MYRILIFDDEEIITNFMPDKLDAVKFVQAVKPWGGWNGLESISFLRTYVYEIKDLSLSTILTDAKKPNPL